MWLRRLWALLHHLLHLDRPTALLVQCLYCFFYTIIIIIIFLAAWHVGSYFPNQGLNPCPLQGKHRVLTTGLPREFLFSMFSASWWASEFPVFSEKLSPLSDPCSLCPFH